MHRSYKIKAVLFDFDGTLTLPGAIDFDGLKEEIGCPPATTAFEYIQSLASEEREIATKQLEQFELEAAKESIPDPDAESVISYLISQNVKVGVLTRNGREPVLVSLENFATINEETFDFIISRDDPVAPKPDAAGVLLASIWWGVDVSNILMVGDYVYDIQAGQNAGSLTAFLNRRTTVKEIHSDFTIFKLDQLNEIVQRGLPKM